MLDSNIDHIEWGGRMLALEKRVNELELNVLTIQHQQRKFYESTTNAIHDLQRSIRTVQNDVHNLVTHQDEILPTIKKLGIWLQQGGWIGQDIQE